MNMLVTVLLLLLFTNDSLCAIRSGAGKNWSMFSNVVITTNVIAVTDSVKTTLHCVMLCLEMQTCVSVFYRRVSRRCQFHDVVFLSPEDGEEEKGAKYYSLTAGSCPLGYNNARLLGLCFRHLLKRTQYEEALADCSSKGEHFIVIDSQEKWDYVSKQIQASSDSQAYSYFIDGSDAENECQWLYHDGRPMTFGAWGEGFPKNKTGDKNYLVASRDEDGFLWRDKDITTKLFYKCQKDI